MPALPLRTSQTDFRYSTHKKCPLTEKEALAAERYLMIYCKPVELYNILQRRAKQMPLFLQRCLSYKIQAKGKKRSRSSTVLFNYRYYYNTLEKTEVTRDFSCPFCSVHCGSIQGLRIHLLCYHDLFNFEFWVSEKFQSINVSVRNDFQKPEVNIQSDFQKPEVAEDELDLKHQPFFYCSKIKRRRKLENLVPDENNVHPCALESDFTEPDCEGLDEDSLPKDSRITYTLNGLTDNASVSNECATPVSENTRAPPTKLKLANTQKISSEQADPRNCELLKKRQFFHSHKAQPMTLEEVFSDHDSEAEVDVEAEDLNDIKFLDDFVDVADEEKQIMHLWNSFVRKQKVLADGHIPWACEAFSRLHGKHLVESPPLLQCWKLFMVKLWSHSLLGSEMMNTCNLILEKLRSEASASQRC